MRINRIAKSPVPHKRFRATLLLDTGVEKYIDFGFNGSHTFTDIPDFDKREYYRLQHVQHPTEKELIQNLVPSPALFTYALLYGKYPSLQQNIQLLNTLWSERKSWDNLL